MFSLLANWLMIISVILILAHQDGSGLDITEAAIRDLGNTESVHKSVLEWWYKMSAKKPIKCHMNFPPNLLNQVGELPTL